MCSNKKKWKLAVKNNKFYEKQGGAAAEYKTYTFGGVEYQGVGYAFDISS